MGPAVDGDFDLLTVETRPLLADIEWGSATVLASLRVSAQRARLAVCLLAALQNLDCAADLRQLLRSDQLKSCPTVCAVAVSL